MANQYNTSNTKYHFSPDPNSKNTPADEIVNDESENIVNTKEQDEVLNEQDNAQSPNEESEEKGKGYQEGLRDDSLTEPELKDSDDQLEFPEEEGN